MKPIVTFLLCLCFNIACGQLYLGGISEFVNFDSSTSAQWYDPGDPNHFIPLIYIQDTSHVVIDSSYRHNKWQIGKPTKQHFTNAYSAPNAIVTDLIQSCIPGDTSVFTINTLNDPWTGLPLLSFLYRFDVDTGDIAKVEVSIDTAKTWTTMYADTFYKTQNYTQVYPAAAPAWDSIVIGTLPTIHNHYFNALYRFTFIAGPSTRSRDGWMIDNIWFGYVAEALPEITRNISASISPNPANQSAIIKYSLTLRSDLGVQLFDASGKEVKYITIKNAYTGQTDLNTSDLPEGMYFYFMKTGYGQAAGKLLISH